MFESTVVALVMAVQGSAGAGFSTVMLDGIASLAAAGGLLAKPPAAVSSDDVMMTGGGCEGGAGALRSPRWSGMCEGE